MKNDTIFVQIASYRDPELLSTIENLLKTAKYKSRLKIGIIWQHSDKDEWDTVTKYKKNKQIKIIDVPIEESKGVCWARAKLQTLYDGEKYTLQLDSHHIMIPDWDEVLIDMLESLRKQGYKKPLLTSYLPAYFPKSSTEPPNPDMMGEPWQMNFDYFLPEGPIFTRPSSIPDVKTLTEPIRARFLSAHFVFVDGRWSIDVPYDEMLYFHGEEPSMAIRSFTHGYDLFHPHIIVGWHEYTRNGKSRHWDDHVWPELDKISFSRTRKLLGMDNELLDFDFGKCGLGTERTLHEYELYAGVKFSTRQVHKMTLDKINPPIPISSEEEFESGLCNRFKYCINIHRPTLTETDYDMWAVAFKDEHGIEIFRQDASESEIQQIMKTNPTEQFINLWREFDILARPRSWIVWPRSVSKGWQSIIQGEISIK
jgi:hypothetical protein